MSQASFRDAQTASRAGYVTARTFVRELANMGDGQFALMAKKLDQGYSYALVARYWNGLDVMESGYVNEYSKPLGKSTVVQLSEAKNAGGGTGAYLEMFAPEVVDIAIQRAREWVAQWQSSSGKLVNA